MSEKSTVTTFTSAFSTVNPATTCIHPSQINPDNINLTNIKQTGEDAEFNLSINQIADEIYNGKEQIVRDWMREILKYPLTTDACLLEENLPKNRYQNILLYDINRVKIVDHYDKDSTLSDYYHASYIDGYDKKNRYILAQAPFDDNTESDFWRMVISVHPSMILFLSGDSNDEKDRTRIPQFWPSKGDKRVYGTLTVKTEDDLCTKDWDTHMLSLFDKRSKTGAKDLSLSFIQYKNWENDNRVPDYILEFRAYCQLKKAEADVKKLKGPVLIVCPTGTHRASFFAAMDIIMDRISQEKRVGVKPTVQIISKQRYGSFVFFEHYCNLVDIIVKHCLASNIVDLHLLVEAQLKKNTKL
ncbi:Protein-tyrosine phosphatase, receptor/non-receptor type domain and Protein-tyrosine/Dual specificity phosphatase domain and Protein-tyrosine phosphatase, catalytic domain-containing protein [Strongyloides ratti]|uniref:Protein-tyrosine phosphatase, receptor/non-receptor type domain and Protein-tyrosine/Dual specificity phosphatase domain and Protein-tyrosine phosphatase, catalytic domain-containing protein n=1 Tax=Strongyloides ratti TaxID=34506 RepID=A0A090MUH7_STRRB|nr:Protein-tyrosine phosphatase, receptor/non-receptor type domain and Protein-tyrosine/Dual specificity phosphatase domain and Protein-tyrosine phosphatase, catalytic domain-containing protein [Strongyloides ratti]CEF62213.1 Protein-tyrosine phosphatase, receptor/non-receptor type domain and Protein-tyrosine/Dual specificity phosphatase domain and Protein-tyrosine phosphatase, catalytic domain-containing protein [Strongyloides ratti]